MRIQHNIMAMNAYRNYNNNTSAVAKNLEKLSSGYRINRAGDDAAGLAISEKMRAQITGLSAAQKNVKDGISLVKTAEGATQEIHDMLNRMVSLAEQSANGTYQNEVDREAITNEFNALKKEINRIADASNFNGIKLLDGSLSSREASDAKIEKLGSETIKGSDRILKDVSDKFEDIGTKTKLDGAAKESAAGSFTIDLNNLALSVDTKDFNGTAVTKAGFKFQLTIDGETFDKVASLAAADAKATYAITVSGTLNAANVNASKAAQDFVKAYSSGLNFNGMDWSVAANNGVLTFTQKAAPTTKKGENLNFDVTISAKDDVSTNGEAVIGGNINAATQPKDAAAMAATGQRANTVFKITEKDITDGSTITIGNKTVTLKVGAKSKTTGTNVVDLSDMEEGSIDLDKALTAIGAKFNNIGDVKGTVEDTAGGVADLLIGVSNDANGHAVGLSVHRTDDDPATTKVIYSTVADLAKEFSMERSINVQKKAVEAGKGLTLQIGDTSDDFNQLTVNIEDMHTDALGLDVLDLGTQEGAQKAVQTIKDAINQVSTTRGTLGATQNRLEHTANNLSTMKENIQDAEATIRDTDIAEEMMAYTKNNILVQSAQAMLAQANQVPQGVLQLLG